MNTSTIRTGEIVHAFRKAIWIEDDLWGARHVMVQHQAEGCEPFCYASFHYDHAYTSNSSTLAAAERVARELGAQGPIERRRRRFDVGIPSPQQLREQIAALQSMLDAAERAQAPRQE
ncbi:MAG: hypothetical protein HKL99_10825 [Burkholderiales bacterium]|nr:hypothetical protein [Burkholderiales bacterium]